MIEGSASVESPNSTLTVEPNQAASLTGTDTFQGVIVPAQRDAFLTAMLAATGRRHRGRSRWHRRSPPCLAATTCHHGGLGRCAGVRPGLVPAGRPRWVPYRHGHWAMSPWGWTWIDDAPWGFAPSHYGRWALRRPLGLDPGRRRRGRSMRRRWWRSLAWAPVSRSARRSLRVHRLGAAGPAGGLPSVVPCLAN